MIRLISILSLSAITLFSLSCADSNETLELSSTPDSAFFLPGSFDVDYGDDGSCSGTECCYSDGSTFAEPRFFLTKVTTTYKGSETFIPVALRITVRGIADVVTETECVISDGITGDGITLAEFLGFGATDPTTGTDVTEITTNNATESFCPIHCGSIGIQDKDRAFTTTAQVELIGIEEDSSGNQKPVTITDTIAIQSL